MHKSRSLASAVIEADSKDQLFSVILVVSCLLHGLAIMAIAHLKPETKNGHSSGKEKISVTLAPDHYTDVRVSIDGTAYDTPTTDNIEAPLTEDVSNSKKNTSSLDNLNIPSATHRMRGIADIAKEKQSNILKPLDLNYKLEEHKSWQKEQGVLTRGGATNNGATIVHGKLLKKVQEAQKRSRYTPSTDDKRDASSVTGGGGSRIVKIGERCFILTEASPLDSIGTETWARIKCKR